MRSAIPTSCWPSWRGDELPASRSYTTLPMMISAGAEITPRSDFSPSTISSTNGFTTTPTTFGRYWRTSRPTPGRTWATPSGSAHRTAPQWIRHEGPDRCRDSPWPRLIRYAAAPSAGLLVNLHLNVVLISTYELGRQPF